MQRVVTISDFNTSNFTALLNNDDMAPRVRADEAPYGQPFQVLADASHALWQEPIDCLVVWTQPERVIAGFGRALENEPVEQEAILAEVDQLAALVRSRRGRARSILIPSWVLPPWERGLGILDMRSGVGVRDLLSSMNQRLRSALTADSGNGTDGSNIFVVDSHRWFHAAGKRGFSPKAWYLGKIPYGNEVFKQAAYDVKTTLRAIAGAARKMVVVDLDETLWGGIVGDVGWENLTLGGHDGEGEALVDFQRALKALTRRGVVLGIVSKNEEDTALIALRNHPEMVLRPEDFAGWRINWEDKARNVVELTAELNLGLQSVVFIDDNPVERARVREALPEVLVPDWPSDKTLYRQTLRELDCFDVPSLTEEDRQRAKMYSSERERKQTLKSVGSLDDWLATLDVVVEVERLNEASLPRAAQLLNKTNQMNLATRRTTEAELAAWSAEPEHTTWTFKVGDKFGDLGLTGILSLEAESGQRAGDEKSAQGGTVKIADFVLSCRVMGRKIEETILAVAIQHARQTGAGALCATYISTAKNKPCLDFFRGSGMRMDPSETKFTWDPQDDYPIPKQVTVKGIE